MSNLQTQSTTRLTSASTKLLTTTGACLIQNAAQAGPAMPKIRRFDPVGLMTAMLLLLGVAPGCKSTGMGSAVRSDVSAQMQSAQTPISACYAQALTSNRRLKGVMMIEFTAEPSTGKFVNGVVARDELNDTPMKTCVLAEVAKLKLTNPQSTKVLVTYPLRFTPTK